MVHGTLTLTITIAQKPYIMGSLGPKTLKYESFEGKGNGRLMRPYMVPGGCARPRAPRVQGGVVGLRRFWGLGFRV